MVNVEYEDGMRPCRQAAWPPYVVPSYPFPCTRWVVHPILDQSDGIAGDSHIWQRYSHQRAFTGHDESTDVTAFTERCRPPSALDASARHPVTSHLRTPNTAG